MRHCLNTQLISATLDVSVKRYGLCVEIGCGTWNGGNFPSMCSLNIFTRFQCRAIMDSNIPRGISCDKNTDCAILSKCELTHVRRIHSQEEEIRTYQQIHVVHRCQQPQQQQQNTRRNLLRMRESGILHLPGRMQFVVCRTYHFNRGSGYINNGLGCRKRKYVKPRLFSCLVTSSD